MEGAGVRNIRLSESGAYGRTVPREIPARLTDDPEQKTDFPDFCHRYDQNPLIFAPGAGQSYCNTDYHLLALITEQVSGMGYGDYVRENIFEKCGLEHTTAVIADNETSVPRVFGDLLEAGIADENGYTMAPRWERGAGGIHTCLADLRAFDMALFSCLLVGEASLEEMTRFDMDYGCGLYPYTKNAFSHSGRDGTSNRFERQAVPADAKKKGPGQLPQPGRILFCADFLRLRGISPWPPGGLFSPAGLSARPPR